SGYAVCVGTHRTIYREGRAALLPHTGGRRKARAGGAMDLAAMVRPRPRRALSAAAYLALWLRPTNQRAGSQLHGGKCLPILSDPSGPGGAAGARPGTSASGGTVPL